VFVDARSVPTNTAVECHICIIGASAAGITLAREFSGQEFHVCLLEGGGLEFDAATQSLYQGKNTGPHQKYRASRNLPHLIDDNSHPTDLWCRQNNACAQCNVPTAAVIASLRTFAHPSTGALH
jgi:choline dehydrogenase-like flavoprotein